ncbi:Maf family protein [Marinibactrum halimedae]|nr:Maf family protein [Marinibactrum halimedae]MCD9458081.1 Maf family protein [Marinibactrum halimedae]
MNNVDVLLSSQSPRRAELLRQIGVRFCKINAECEEVLGGDESAPDYVQRLASDKAQAGWQVATAEGLRLPVLGSDTTVACEGRILEKPSSLDEAMAMLRHLSGGVHQVYTGVSLIYPGLEEAEYQQVTRVAKTDVWMRPISDAQIEAYWKTGEPKDKAGGYGIQGFGSAFVEKISGSFTNVVGLPLEIVVQLCEEYNIPIWQNDPNEIGEQ